MSDVGREANGMTNGDERLTRPRRRP